MAYRIGAAAVVTGAVIAFTSGLFGGPFYGWLTELLELLDAPEDRSFLHPDLPEAGAEILEYLGGLVAMCGIWMFSLRLIAELLGLASRPALTGNMGPKGKLASGLVAAGLLVNLSAAIPGVLFYDFARPSANEPGLLAGVAAVGTITFLLGLAVLLPAGYRRLTAFLRWTNRAGWGRLRWGWVNRLGLGLALLAFIAGVTVGWSGPVAALAAVGIGVVLAGIIPHLLLSGRP